MTDVTLTVIGADGNKYEFTLIGVSAVQCRGVTYGLDDKLPFGFTGAQLIGLARKHRARLHQAQTTTYSECPDCRGEGYIAADPDVDNSAISTCWTCGGIGFLQEQPDPGPDTPTGGVPHEKRT